MKNTIISALNFYILKTNLSKIASKEVQINVFENYFLKKGVVQQLLLLGVAFYSLYWFKSKSMSGFKRGSIFCPRINNSVVTSS